MRTRHAMKRHRSGKIAAGNILLAVHTEDGEDIGTSGEARAA